MEQGYIRSDPQFIIRINIYELLTKYRNIAHLYYIPKYICNKEERFSLINIKLV